MKIFLKNKVFFGLFIVLTIILTSILSSGVLTSNIVYAAEYPTGPSTDGYLDALALKAKQTPEYAGANIDWYLANPYADEFYISTPAELFGMGFLVNVEVEDPPLSGWAWNVDFEGKTVNLVNNIDLSAINNDYTKFTGVYTYGQLWIEMGWGDYSEPDTGPGTPQYAVFKGTFEGNGYAISGLADRSLFGTVISATIQNLSTSGTLTSRTQIAQQHRIAGIVNTAVDSTLINLKSDVDLVFSMLSFASVGGIVTEVMGNTAIIGCEFSGTLANTIGLYSGANPVGGIIGQVGMPYFDTAVTVNGCVNYADITTAGKGGGIVGGTVLSTKLALSANIVIQNCVNYGNIVAAGTIDIPSYSIGGILGASSTTVAPACPMSVTIDGCANYGAINGGIHVAGGIAGYIQQGNLLSITNSYNRGDVTSQAASGGIVGRIDNANGAIIKNTYDIGVITGTNVGGFVGIISGGTVDSVNNYYLDTSASGAVNSADYTGVTTKTSTEMKNPTFAIQLGNAYTPVTDNYPILTWQTQISNAVVTLNGDTDIAAGSDATYTISVGNVNKLATITLWFEVDGTYFTGKTFKGLNGFNLLGNIDWTQNDNTWTGRATLINLNTNGISTDDTVNIFEMTFSSNTNQLGTTNIKLVKANLSGYNDNTDKAIPIDSTITNNTIHTLINQYFSKYDTNKDGKINQLDLTTAQLYYLSEKGDANWNTAKTADINNDGRVDIEDLILILGNINWSSPIL
ncbi:MAG: dockerin type I repeat-containing protein [Candidatus Bathyarchaeota archaeon]|nr:dockerin type I repeat-containing protein [Candidatus Termiticorpusculum sp.]